MTKYNAIVCKLIHAVQRGTHYNRAGLRVFHTDNNLITNVWLDGSRIFTIHRGKKYVEFSMAGQPSLKTRNRINGLLDFVGYDDFMDLAVIQRNGQQVITTDLFRSNKESITMDLNKVYRVPDWASDRSEILELDQFLTSVEVN